MKVDNLVGVDFQELVVHLVNVESQVEEDQQALRELLVNEVQLEGEDCLEEMVRQDRRGKEVIEVHLEDKVRKELEVSQGDLGPLVCK